jgi:hypothetical protein
MKSICIGFGREGGWRGSQAFHVPAGVWKKESNLKKKETCLIIITAKLQFLF